MKIDGLKIFARKGWGVRQNGGGLSRNGEGVGGLIYYIEVFLEIPHDAAQEKNLDVFIFPLLTNMCCKIIAQIKYEIIGIVIVLRMLIVIIVVLLIHANNKNST